MTQPILCEAAVASLYQLPEVYGVLACKLDCFLASGNIILLSLPKPLTACSTEI